MKTRLTAWWPDCSRRVAEAVLAAARSHPAGAQAAIVGEVGDGLPKVSLRTGLGVTRPLIMLAGDQLPRIC